MPVYGTYLGNTGGATSIVTIGQHNNYIYTYCSANGLTKLDIATNTVTNNISNFVGNIRPYNLTIYNGNIYMINNKAEFYRYNISANTYTKELNNIGTGIDQINGSCFDYPYLYFNNSKGIGRVNITTNPVTDVSLSWCTTNGGSISVIGDRSIVTDNNGYLYTANLAENTSPIHKIDISNPSNPTVFMPGVYNTDGAAARVAWGLAVYVNYLYVTEEGKSHIHRYRLTDPADTNQREYGNSTIIPSLTTGLCHLTPYKGNLYAAYYNSSSIGRFALPIYPDPSNIAIDDVNTQTVASGNVQVSIIDGLNGTIYATRYWYSIDGGVTYIRTRTGPSGSATTYPRFYIPGLPFGQNTIYVYAKHDAGNSAPVIANVFVLTTPNSISNCSVSSIGIGNINVSITETLPPKDYYLNNVSYRYYLYTGGENQYANGLAYTFGANMDPSYNASFVINNLPTNNYRVYLIAQNSFGNTASASSFFANVTVYTPPSSISFNTGNTSIVTPGNLKVTVNDTTNVATNGIYYFYSIDGGATYANSTVPNNGPTKTSYTFYVTYNPTAIQPIYVKAQNPVGTSNLIFVNVNSPYNPYLYVSNNLQLQNGTTNYSFYVPNLTNKVYPLYLNAKNTLGYSANSAPYNVTVYTTPLPTVSFDMGNIKTVSGGNLQVRLIDLSNTTLNGVYYQYSINGNAYINSGVYSGTSPYTFYIAPTNPVLDISNTIYVKASNPVGNSSPEISLPVIVYQIPRKPPQVTFELMSSGNVRVSINEKTLEPIPYYYLNNVSYSLYAYNTANGTNLSGNTSASIYNYSAGILSNTDATYGNVVSYVNTGLNANTYTVYVIAKNVFGNSTPFSANIAVYTTPEFPPKIDTTNTISATAGNLTVSITDPSNNTRNAISYWYYVFDSSAGANDSGNVLAYSDTGATLTTGAQQSFLLSGYTNKTYTLYLLSKNPVGTSTSTSAAVTIYTVPNMPTRFDSGNTTTVKNSSGNLKVSFFDTSNASLNNVYYWYSTNGTLYSNTNIKNTNSTNPYSFFIYPLTTIQSNIYVRASNTVGNSSPLTQTFTVLQTPRAPPVFIANLVDSGKVQLTVRETNDVSPRPDNYYLNGVSYYYYLYTNGVGNNLSANLQVYTNLVGNLNSSGYPDTELLVTGLSTSTMTFYVVAKNDVGYSNTVSANVTVYTAPNSFSFDSGNTKTVSSGNLRVSFIDQYNSTANGVYYKYSTDGTNYDNANILSIGSSIYQFYIPGLLNASYTISLIALNAVGCTAPVSITTTVYTTPQYAPVIDTANTKSTTSGNLTISINDSVNSSTNGIYYLYSMNGTTYGNSRVAKTSTATNYQFTINNTGNSQVPLIGNVYSLTVAASNTVGTIYSNAYAVNVYTSPLVPFIDAGNTKSITSGNLNISINDSSNSSTNGIYYLYSTDGITYGNSGVAKTSSATNFKFTINNTGNAQIPLIGNVYSLYIKVENPTGNAVSSPLSVNVYTTPLVPSFDAGNTKSTTAGNLTVSIRDTSNKAINNIYYFYSTDRGNTYANTFVKNTDSTEPYTFSITSLPTIQSNIYVRASNTVGNSIPASQTFTVYQTPRTPPYFAATLIDSGNVLLTVRETNDVSPRPDNYYLNKVSYYYYLYTDGVGANDSANIGAYTSLMGNLTNAEYPDTSIYVSGLPNATSTFYVIAKNTVGYSDSISANVTVYNAPSNITIDTGNTQLVASGNVKVVIYDPINTTANNVYYKYSLDESMIPYIPTNVQKRDGDSRPYFYINGLSAGTYPVLVSAYNTVGNTDIAYTTVVAYTTPTNITFDVSNTTVVSGGNLKIVLTDPTNADIDNVYYWHSLNGSTYANSGVKATTPAASSYTFTVTGLTDISYSVSVIAKNPIGNSAVATIPKIVYTTPVAPTAYSVAFVESGNIRAEFTDINANPDYESNEVSYWYYLYNGVVSENNLSSIVSAYTPTNIQYSKSVSTSAFYIDQLAANQYTLYLYAKNKVGNSPIISSTLSVYTNPSPPTSVSISTNSSGTIQVSIVDTSNTAINNVYYYYYVYSAGDINDSGNTAAYTNSNTQYVSSASTFNIPDLSPNNYTVYIRAKNVVGYSTSIVSSTLTVFTVPATPQIDAANTTSTNGNEITVTIIDTSNSAINNIYYHYSIDNGQTYSNTKVRYTGVASQNRYSYVITAGLYNGQEYTIYTIAKNLRGSSAPIVSGSILVYSTPNQPTIVATPNDRMIDIAITPPANNGNAISGYAYLVSPGIGTYTNIGVPVNNIFSIPDLQNGTLYSVRVIAINARGNSLPSAAVSAKPFGLSAAPNIYVKYRNNIVDVSFDTPDSNGTEITNYRFSLNGEFPTTGNVGLPPDNYFSIRYLTAGNTYALRVYSESILGLSAPSNTITLTPGRVPDEPFIINTVPLDGAIEIELLPGFNGGSSIIGYTYAYIEGSL